MRGLYVSHIGMLEGLGQSQVLPYLRGLAKRGADIEIVSFELSTVTEPDIERLRASLSDLGMRWTPLLRRRDTRLGVKLFESMRGVAHAFSAALARRPDVVHGRSYLPTAVADVVASVVPKAGLLFDCRGMIGDEYVDAGHWTTEQLEYRLLKRYERRAFRRADGVVVLTEALRSWMTEREWFGESTQVETIPCCVDLERFRFDAAARDRVRNELGFDDRLILVYSGSLGTWYRERELARFAGVLKQKSKRPISFLLLTQSNPAELSALLRAEGLADDEIVVRAVAPGAMASHLSAGDIGLSFIKSCFSKKGSSPTKLAEYLACGLTAVLNGDIGDQADLRADGDACVVVDEFSNATLEAAAESALRLAERPLSQRVATSREVARRRFDLESVGVARYERLYERVAGRAGS